MRWRSFFYSWSSLLYRPLCTVQHGATLDINRVWIPLWRPSLPILLLLLLLLHHVLVSVLLLLLLIPLQQHRQLSLDLLLAASRSPCLPLGSSAQLSVALRLRQFPGVGEGGGWVEWSGRRERRGITGGGFGSRSVNGIKIKFRSHVFSLSVPACGDGREGAHTRSGWRDEGTKVRVTLIRVCAAWHYITATNDTCIEWVNGKALFWYTITRKPRMILKKRTLMGRIWLWKPCDGLKTWVNEVNWQIN